MAQQVNSTFTRYKLSEDEQKAGTTLTSANIFVIQNFVCDAAEEKLNLKFDPQNPLVFAQREAELQGQIGILKLLLELSAATSPTFTI